MLRFGKPIRPLDARTRWQAMEGRERLDRVVGSPILVARSMISIFARSLHSIVVYELVLDIRRDCAPHGGHFQVS